MKLKVLLILSVLFNASCNRTEIEKEQADNELIGNWSLMSITQENYGTENFVSGDILWTFKSNTTVIVTLNVTPNLDPVVNTNGNYHYEYANERLVLYLEEESCTFEVSIDSDAMTLSRETEEGKYEYEFEKY